MWIADRRLLALLLAGVSSAASAATIQIIHRDAAGVGFNDPSPANPAAGSNGATTLGAQRLAVIEHAAGIWARELRNVSDVPIRVTVQMVVQPCGDEGTTLASAGPVDLAANFPNAPKANTAYHIALANALAGRDLVPERADINANFNLAIDSGCSAGSVGWWYGLDPDVAVPADRTALLPVALHELAHGLGFSVPIDVATGVFSGSSPPIWMHHLYDLQTMKHWRSMTPAERIVSARNDPHLVWTGRSVNRFSSLELTGAPALRYGPTRDRIEDLTDLGLAQFGAAFPTSPLSGHVVAVNDGIAAASGDAAGTVHDGCEFPFRNGARLAGRIALVDRGLCPFVDKARHAQRHGAIAVIVANNVDGAPPGMAGSDPEITIPVVAVTRNDGRRMRRSLLRPSLMVTFGLTDGLAGTRQGCVRMYAPPDASPGSSISHFHRTAHPDLLMEPSITRERFDDLDLTPWLLQDIGWGLSYVFDPTPPNPCAIGPLP